jgi:hypothetical protein
MLGVHGLLVMFLLITWHNMIRLEKTISQLKPHHAIHS